MLGKMRVISPLSLSVVMLLLLTLKVLPHHHHTLHLPGSDTVVETLHFGVEECEDDCDSSHDHCEKCPSEHTYCLLKACEELNYYKSHLELIIFHLQFHLHCGIMAQIIPTEVKI